MKLMSKQVRKKFKEMWPNLSYIWLFDRKEWLCLPLDHYRKLLDVSKIPQMQWIDEFNDCDDFALQFMAEVRRKRYFSYVKGIVKREDRIPLAIFNAFGDQFRGMQILHMLNAVICDDGNIYLIDSSPDANRIWKANNYDNNVLFISSV